MIKNAVKHFILITKHKWLVFKFCCKIGIPFRGLMHDWSKYSPTEFWESAKYYNGKRSPISLCKEDKGFSNAWLHHKGRNKHHYEYWVDDNAPIETPIIPYKYVAEMICDKISAGITYNGKKFTNRTELEFWEIEKTKIRINKHIEDMLTEVFEQIADNGINSTLKRKNIKALYKKYCEVIDENKI